MGIRSRQFISLHAPHVPFHPNPISSFRLLNQAAVGSLNLTATLLPANGFPFLPTDFSGLAKTMATSTPPPTPVEEPAPSGAVDNPPDPPEPSTPAPNSDNPTAEPKELTSSATPLPAEPSTQTISIPSYSRWFSFQKIHETERRFLPEFFDSRTPPSKNPSVYKYYRDSIVRRFRKNPSRKVTFTEVRKTLVGDVGSIRRVFDFLEGWGLINYTGAVGLKLKGEEKESKSGGGTSSPCAAVDSPLEKKESVKKVCGGCKTVCSQVCFACDKVDLLLCSRCFVRGNYRVGLNSGDFKRVDINEETKTDWTEKETLHLLEAILQFGDDWKKVAEHIGTKNEKDCVSRFIKLPFGEQFLGPLDIDEVGKYYQIKDHSDVGTEVENSATSSPAKKRCLTPLADASNPIMGQAAFLSAVVGSEVARAAAQAAVTALSEGVLPNIHTENRENIEPLAEEIDQEDDVAAKCHAFTKALEQAHMEAQDQLKKEEADVERSITAIIEGPMKEFQEKIARFENSEIQMEKEWQQLTYLKNLFFTDQFTVLQHRTPSKFAESGDKENKSTDATAG